MRKYTPRTVFLGIYQLQTLIGIAAKSREPKNPPQQVWSVSKLVRAAVVDFIQRLEEWDDAVKYKQSAHKDMPKSPAPTLKALELRQVMDEMV